jgi:4-hydroxy-tetrahydrodipicolinate synthase
MAAAAFEGVYPILYAFFDRAGRLDRGAMRRQALACVAGGAHGIAALGLATEVGKLSAAERRQVMEWVVEDVAGRLPVAITVFGETPEIQAGFVRAAADLGAAWVILQPPPTRPITEAELVRFFGRVMDASPLPVAVQNAPQYIGVGLSDAGLLDSGGTTRTSSCSRARRRPWRSSAPSRGSAARSRCSTAAPGWSCRTACAPAAPG